MLEFEQKVYDTIHSNNMLSEGDRVVVGVSGGADSVALLCALKSIEDLKLDLHVCHINHNIRGSEADRDENYVKDLCKKLNIPCYTLSANVPQIAKDTNVSEEVAGRNIRYDFFEKTKNKVGANRIAVAQNKNDFCETVFLNITRGCTLNGLKGISAVRDNIIRPLINIKRSEIEKYLQEKNMCYMNDSTNYENDYSRNIVRNLALPALSQINPSIVDTVYRNSSYIESDNDFINQYAKKLFEKCAKVDEDVKVNMAMIKDEHIAVKRRIIMLAIKTLKGDTRDVWSEHIEKILSLNISGTHFESGHNLTVFYNYDILRFVSGKSESNDFIYEIACNSEITVNNIKYTFSICKPDNMIKQPNVQYLCADTLKDKLIVRNRRDGDRFNPYGMSGSKKLKDFFIDIKIPSYQRNDIPLLLNNDEIISVLGYRISNKYAVTDNTKYVLKITKENAHEY